MFRRESRDYRHTAHAMLSRRELLAAAPAVALLPGALVQGPGARPSLSVRTLNHMTLTVSDVKRSLEFYQGLFGMPIQARQGQTTLLRIGGGPQFIALSAAGPTAKPHINHYCFTVEDFAVDRLLNVLSAHGVTKAEAGVPGGGLSGGPMKVRVRMRGPEAGGAQDGTPELYVGDPSGVVVQLQDPRYCGGAGGLGERCLAAPEAAPKKGLLTAGDLSHFTMRVSDPDQTIRFYRDVFGLPIQVYQGKVPALGVARGPQFVMFTGMGGGGSATASAGAAARPGQIHHACLTVEGFDVDRIFKVLSTYGLKPRGEAQGEAPPLTFYVSLRMPDRGGAPKGTPELYFTDPDGLIIQLQDPRYCGGGGLLGEVCS